MTGAVQCNDTIKEVSVVRERRDEVFQIRISAAEKEELFALAEQAQLSVAEWVRLCALTSRAVRRRVSKSRPTVEAEQLLHEVLG